MFVEEKEERNHIDRERERREKERRKCSLTTIDLHSHFSSLTAPDTTVSPFSAEQSASLLFVFLFDRNSEWWIYTDIIFFIGQVHAHILFLDNENDTRWFENTQLGHDNKL